MTNSIFRNWRRPRDVERWIRETIALSFLILLVAFYVWFIVTHLEGISN